jgi:endo-1,4-beta-xylanase
MSITMKTYKNSFKKLMLLLFVILSVHFIFKNNCYSQDTDLDESIAKYRKGELIIKAERGSQVTVEQMRHEFWFGCAIPNSLSRGMSQNDLQQFKEKFLENFNSAVTENALKWMMMERNKGEVNYTVVDSILKWCDENDIPLRGHNLFWGKTEYVQPWVMELDDNELKQTLQYRAESITKHYKGRFAEYDLNNEMLDKNYYEERLGPDITKLMSQWVHNGDPDARLFVNEYDILIPPSPESFSTDFAPGGFGLVEYMTMIRKYLNQGIPIAGIGVQGHSHLETFDRQYLREALDSLATFNIPIRITEFNMPGMRSKLRSVQLTTEQEDSKAKEIVDFYRICFAHPAVEGILMWGFWEGANWIPSSSLYKRDWTPTPSADAYKNLVFKEWWTNESGVTGSGGQFSTPAFFGKYKITVNGVSKEVDLTKEKGKVTVDFR